MSDRGLNLARKFQNVTSMSLMAIFCLFSTAFAAAQTTFSVSSPVNFGSVAVNTSKLATIHLQNNQAVSLNFSAITVGAPYAFTTGAGECTVGTPVAAGASCALNVTLTPTTLGAQPIGTLSVADDAVTSPQTLSLKGTGVLATTVSSSSLTFGSVVVGQTSAIESVILTNNQTAALAISSLAVSGSGYALDPSTTCPSSGSLAATSNCTIALTLTPSSTGSLPGSLTINTNAANSPLSVVFSGSGVGSVALSPSSVAFASQVINTTSATKTVTLQNNEAGPLSITSVVFGGPFALDTSAVTTCPHTGSVVSGSLASNTSCVIGITFDPTAIGAASGQITVIDNAASSPQFSTLSGSGVFATVLSHAAIDFGNVVQGTTSAVQNVVVTNNQTVALNFSSITAPLPYSVSAATTTCKVGTPLASKANCVIALTFKPTSLGAAAASQLTVASDAATSPQSVTLTGNGVTPVTLGSTLPFGLVVVGTPAVEQISLKNNQTVALTINAITGFSGGYTLSTANTTCPLSPNTLAPGTACLIGVSLTATAVGPQPDTVTVNHNAAGSPQSFTVSGSAVQPVALSPTLWTFPAQYQGTTSAPRIISLVNAQSVPLHISTVSITGPNSADFAVTPVCPIMPTPVPASSICTLSVTFTPTASGTRTATLSVADDALGTPQTVALYGSGNSPITLTPNSITNFYTNVGTTSAYQTVVIQNTSTAPYNLTAFQFSGDFVQTSTTCGASLPFVLAAGASCNVTVSFDPTIGGVRGGQLQVYDNAITSPQVVNLSGTGANPLTISPSSLAYSALLVGTTSPAKTITLTNHESKSETFTLTPTGDFTANSNCAGGIIAAKSSCLLYVDFVPSATGARSGSLSIAHTAAIGSPVVASLTGSGTATNPAPAVAVVSPGAGASGTAVPVVITGNTWTHFTNASVVTFVETTSPTTACNIATSAVSAPNANTINATLTLSGGIFGACNIIVKTPLSGGGTETATLASAFTIADPTQAHTITAVSPAFGIQGQNLNVAITAVGTHFVQGVTISNFGDGVSVNSLIITDATDAVANISISNTTPIGYRTITMQTDGEFAISVLTPQNNPIFQIGPNNATLVSVNPNSAPQGGSLQVTLTATGTHFLQNATQVSIGGAIVGDVNVTSPTVAVAEVAVPAGAPVGPQNVQINTGGEITGLNNAFTITGATPALLTVAPSSGVQGQSLNVVITGNAFTNFVAGSISADFTGEISVGSIVVNSTHQVTVPITIHGDANVGGITATLVSGTTNFPFSFTVTQSSASIVSVVPSNVPQGGQVTLAVTGANTSWTQADTKSQFYPTGVPTPAVDEVTINSATSAALAIAVPTTTPPGSYSFYMATGGQIVNAAINVYANTPTLTMSPANGLLPTAPAVNSFTANFTGQFTHWGTTTLPVIAGEGVTLSNFVVNSPVSASATVTIIPATNGTPTATGARLVTFTTGGEIVTTYFNVTSTPVGLISISPDHTATSTTVDVGIVGLNTHFTTGTTQVLFGPQITVNSVTVTDDTHLTANITTSYLLSSVLTPSPSGWQQVYVNTGAEQVIGGFLVDYPISPSLVSVTPSSGAQGSTESVTIKGNLTSWVQGTTEAILGAGVTVSDLTIVDSTTATATIAISPTAPVGGNSVVMITGTEIESGSGFSVTPSASSIVSVGPAVNCVDGNFVAVIPGCGGTGTGPWVVAQLRTTTLNIVGLGTHWLQGETVVSFGPGVVVDTLTVSSPTTAQVQITVLSSAPVGFATLTTTTDGEVVSLQQAIDIEEGSPILLAIAPTAGQQGTTLNVQVLGRFTSWGAGTSAAFNQDITVNSINVIDSENMIANVTISPNAYVDFGFPCGHVLTVTTGNEQVSTTQTPDEEYNFCVQQGAEEITLVNPSAGVQGSTESVTITGSATNFIAGISQVSFNDGGISVGTVQVNSPTSITVPVAVSTSSSVGFHTVTVTTLGEVAQQQFAFTVSPGVATLNEAIPNQAEQGVQNLTVQLIGQYSHFNSQSTATFGPGITVESISWVSATEVDAVIDISPVSYPGGSQVTVTTPGVPCSDQPPQSVSRLRDTSKFHRLATYAGCTPGSPVGTGSEIVTANVFTIIPGPAIISQVAPNTGNEGQEVIVNITGHATHWAQNFTQFYIAGGGSDITINSVVINNATSATVDLSISPTANPGARSVYMVTAGESLTDSGAFVVTGGVPVITYLSPNGTQNNPSTGTTGLEVTINGLYTNWSQAVTTVNFGPGITVESYQVEDATHIEAVIDIAANAQDGYRTVFVQTGPQGLTSNFLVSAPAPPPTPYIWYESPSSGIPGQTFTITFYGAYTHWDPNPTTGTVLTGFAPGITLNTFQVTSPTSALANITISPTASASTSDLTLTTNTATPQEVDNAQFNVVVAQPTLSIVDPGSGLQGATNLTVNILGQFTNFDSTTTFNFGQGVTVNGPPVILGPGIATQSISIDQLATLGGRSVTATTEGTTVGGAGFTVTPSLALISAITPNTALQGTTITVDVTGQNTHWDGATTFQFGAGIVVTSTTVNTNTDATLTLALPALASVGPTYVSATTLGEVANISNGFVVQAGTPLLLSSGPGSVPQQSSAVFTILSQATQWLTNPPTVSYGDGITLTHTVVTGDTSLTVDGFAQPTTAVGYRNLTVTTGTQVLGLQNAVYVSPGPAIINGVSANTGGQGQTLTVAISGINTHWLQGTTTLTFPEVLVNSFTVISPTSISANITVSQYATAGQVSVSATTLGEVATGVNVFTVTQTQPELLAVVLSSGAQGLTESVTLTGAFTHFVNGTTTANFGTGITVNSVTVSSATSASANITISPITTLGYRTVSVTTGTEAISLTNAFQVTVGPAAIDLLNPATGGQGNTVTVAVTGSQTHFAQGTTTASFGGGINVTGITVTDALHASVNISIPNSTTLGTYNVSLTTGGEVASILGDFTVTTGAPELTVVNPPTGTQGEPAFNVNLTGVFTSWVNGTSTASFGAGITVNTLTVNSATTAVANISISPTATLGSRNVSVTTGAQVATLTGGFSVLAGVPTLLTTNPTFAQAGTSANVVITGEFTTFQQGFSTVSFGSGVNVTLVTVNSTTQLTASISVAPNTTVGTRSVSVTTNSQNVTLTNGFNVTAGTPVITQINPNIGNPATTISVTINGQYTNWVNGTTTASFGPQISVGGAAVGASGPVTVTNSTTLTASITIPSGATVGPQDVTTTTGAEVETVTGGFTIQAASIPAPSLISLSPGPNVNYGTVPINSSFTAVFSQPMNRTTLTTSTVELWLISNPNSGFITVPGTVTVDATGRVMTFTPTSLLAVNSQYYMLLTNGIQDATGNTFPQYGYVSFYTVDSANTTPVTVTAANPPANATNVGTNVTVELEFNTDMEQSIQTGFTVSNGGSDVPGTWSWNSNPYGQGTGWGPATLLYFTPASPLAAGTTYTVSYGTPLADTAGNALTPGSFTFTTGSGADTAPNYTGSDFVSGETNVGTNFEPKVVFSKPVNPIDINTGTLLLYNADSGKYIPGTVTVAPNGLGATFTPSLPLLPDTYYRIHIGCGNYDMDGNYLNCVDGYFTTGNGSDLAPPTVASFFPPDGTTSVPLNANVVVHFSEPIDPATYNAIVLTPTAGGSAIAGTNSLGGDQVTLTFTPTPTSELLPGKQYTVTVSGYSDLAGNSGSTFTSKFTTATSAAVINVSTGLNAAGNLITTGDTIDPHWFVNGTATNAEVVAPTNADWWSPWLANGPNSSWIAPNPDVAASAPAGNTLSTTFNWSGSTTNICLAGTWGSDGYGTLELNGQPVLSSNVAFNPLASFNVSISSSLAAGTNTLTLVWGSAYSGNTGFRLGAVVETCGANFTGGLTLTSATPAYQATAVPTNTTITLNFNHPLDPATVNATTLPVMIGYNSSQEIAGAYVVTGSQVVFTPDSPFPVNTTIYVGTCNGPTDTAGDIAGGCYTQLTYFTTGSTATVDATPFQVMAFSPSSGATNVGLRSPVTATFNRSVSPGSINSNDFALFQNDGQTPWCTSYSRSQDGATLSFNCDPLPSSTPMTAVLNAGIQDWTGDSLAPYTSQFTTTYYDYNTHGSIIASRPGSGGSGITTASPLVLFTNVPVESSTAQNGLQVAQNNVAVPGTVQVLDGGYTMVFTPSSPFTAGALIQWWTTGTLTDTAYNSIFNSASGYFYVASSTATLTPTVQVASPPASTNPIPTNSVFDIQFNTPLNASTVNSTNIYLYDSSAALHLTGTYSMPQPNEVRIVPSAPLSPNDYIYVYVTTGLQSTTSVPATANQWYDYTGTTTDTTLPTIASAVPYNGATNVGVNVQPGVVFSKTIDPVSVNSTTFQVTNGGTPLAGTYWFSSNDTRVEFVPNAPLPASTNLVMKFNGVTDWVGNPVTFTSNFTTAPGPDFTAPSVEWTSVTSNGSIPTNSTITVQFSESMDVTTFNTSNIRVYDTLTGLNIAATLTWNATQTVAYFVPSAPLAAGRQYYFSVNSGTDLAGNQVNGVGLYFTAEYTSASVAPTVVAFNPLGGATGIGTNAIVEAEFSAPIDPNTLGAVTLTNGGTTVLTTPSIGAGNTVVQLVPATPLLPTTTYVMTIAGVKDPAGNTVATVTNSFTTGATFDITAASAINSDPPNNATVGINIAPKFVFNKPLNPLTVSNSTFRMYLVDTGQFIPLTVTESASGLEVTMTPQIPLLPNTKYHYQACCGYQDQDGNNGNEADLYFWTNNGTDTTGPTVTVSPIAGATGIPLNAQVIVSVSAPIDLTSWGQNSIQLLNGSTPVAGTVSAPTSQELVFVPASNLTASTTYTVKVNGFTDANENAVVPSNTSFTTGTVASTGGLTLTSTNIPNGSTGVSTTQPIILTFSQILDPTTVNSNTLLVMDTYNSNDGLAGTYVVSGNQVTFTPTSPYPSGATIYVGACDGPTDVLGEVFQNGSCYVQLVGFTVVTGTPDTTPLTVLSVSPAAGATNVRPDVPVSVTFNKSINSSTASNNGGNNALLFAGQGLQDRGSITMSADNRTLTFNSGVLSTGTAYTISLPAGGISDPSGNTLASTFTSTFTTGTNPTTAAGSVVSVAPGNGASGVPVNSLLTLYINQPVDAATLTGNLIVTVNGQVYAGTAQTAAGGYEAQFVPTVPFPNNATVQWWFSNVLDTYGNSINGDSGYFYTVAAINPATAQPTIIAVSPVYGSSNAPTNAQIDILYNLPIDPTTVNSTNVYFNTGLAATITMPSANLIHVVPTAGSFSPSTTYYLCANSGVKGTNGVATQGNCWTTYFTTTTGTSTTSGTVTIGPPNGSVNIGTNTYIRLGFSKPVDLTTINATNVKITTGGNPIPGSWSYVYSSNDVVAANYSPLNPLPPSSNISITVNGLLDYAGNEFTGATAQFTTAATPDYSTPSVTLDFGNNTSGIATNASFTCLYSEPMDPSSITPSNTYLYSYVTNAVVPVTYNFASDLMAVTMTPKTALFANSEYNYYCEGAISLTGVGQYNASSYFYTGNGPTTTGPVLVYANPPSGLTNVPVNSIGGPWNNTSLMLLFNEPISTESMASITFTPNGGSAEPIAVYPEDGNFIADVQLPWAMMPNTKYTFNFAGVTDINGNPASGTTTSSFTTGSTFDWTNPTITTTIPANSATAVTVSTPLSITFSEAMDPILFTSSQIYLRTHNTQTTVPTTLTLSSDYTTVTLTPMTPLAESTIYDLIYNPNPWYLYDIAGNPSYSYGTESTFTTGTAAAVNGACGSANGTTLAAAPTANLCSVGTASAVTNPGSWTWTCNGNYGGTNASCSATVAAGPACFAQPASLVSLWPGNDNTNDVGPGGNNGTLENGVTYALGEVGDAFDLSGSNQYVLIGQPVPTNLQIQNAITLSAWIYVPSYPGGNTYATIVGSEDGSNTSGASILIDGSIGVSGVPPGALEFDVGNGTAWSEALTTTQVPLNQWVLVTATGSASNPLQIYFDGVLQPTSLRGPTWAGTISYTGSWFAIGQTVSSNWPFTGLINDAGIFDAALTGAQVQAIYTAGRSGVCP